MIQKRAFCVALSLTALVFAGCGSVSTSDTTQQKVQEQKADSGLLNDTNYEELAQYYYLHELITTSAHQKRSFLAKSDTMTHIQRSQPKKQKNVFYVKSVKSPQGYLHFLKVNYNDKTIEINADKEDKKIIHLTYTNPKTKTVVNKDFTFAEFTTVHDEGVK